ncbi:basic phospholipase A2 RVV-VD-like [Lingula anatina]|uniref:Phospholipase A2 n=1 Tax=Lingula anatina TaxID=7574 RepID=A0A1S3I7H7_LINAN|nr:basic phospholipase A2 RVV-VD-like [Lingula anatina]|eukprot:XP_013393806.1 basic phospholipase A2 RVV-VD-like [Lingula anatina]
MKTALTIFTIAFGACFLYISLTRGEVHPRPKRNVFQFATMIIATTGRNPFDYNGYGCWCGLGGKGKPKDEVDRCCQVHDYCYKALYDRGCFSPVLNGYKYTLEENIICLKDKNDDCEQGGCECDREAAHCFGNNTYHKQYKRWPQRRC